MKTLRALFWFCMLLPLIFAAVILVILAEAMSKRAPIAEVETPDSDLPCMQTMSIQSVGDDAELDEFAQEEIEV